MKTGLLVGALVVPLLVGLFLLSALVLMLLTNVVLHHFGLTTLDFTASMAIVALLGIYGGASRVKNGKD